MADEFLKRPDYQECQSLNIHTLRSKALSHSKNGHYTIATLWQFRKVWFRDRKPKDFLAYLIFRRALGYSLTQSKAVRLEEIIASPWCWLQGFYGHVGRQAHQLLMEFYFFNPGHTASKAAKFNTCSMLSNWQKNQSNWHEQFLDYLTSTTKIQLVGNSSKLHNLKLGESIDKADCVVRFNHYCSNHVSTMDIGSKCTIWVIAPGFRPTRFPNCDWVIISGPDMLRWQQQWGHLESIRHTKFLSIPLSYWRELVRVLAAPPSSGLLTLHFFSHILSDKDRLEISGFGYNPSIDNTYHVALQSHKATTRHNWLAEIEYIRNWSDHKE